MLAACGSASAPSETAPTEAPVPTAAPAPTEAPTHIVVDEPDPAWPRGYYYDSEGTLLLERNEHGLAIGPVPYENTSSSRVEHLFPEGLPEGWSARYVDTVEAGGGTQFCASGVGLLSIVLDNSEEAALLLSERDQCFYHGGPSTTVTLTADYWPSGDTPWIKIWWSLP